jgi:predicted nucleic acid-binding protein
MTKLIYVDTNIYLDYFDGRRDNLRPLGEFAYHLLKRALQCEFKIILSSLVVDEIEYNSYFEKFIELRKSLQENNKCVIIVENYADEKETRRIVKERETSFNDTKHAVLARRAKADYLITRNIQDFIQLRDLINIALPENL